jgi:hypothetical protein
MPGKGTRERVMKKAAEREFVGVNHGMSWAEEMGAEDEKEQTPKLLWRHSQLG